MTAKLKVVPASTFRPGDPDDARYELARVRSLARAWITQTPEPRRKDMGAIFVCLAFERLAANTAPDLRLSEPFTRPYGVLDASARALAEALGDVAAALPLIEAAHGLASLYTTLLPGHDRSALGAFYTPPPLVERLIELSEEAGIDWSRASVLDPASGGGAFLLPVAKRMLDALEGADPKVVLAHIGRRLKGLELDPHAAGFAQWGLELLLAPTTLAARRSAPRLVEVADTLEAAPKPIFDLVIGNPPYGRITLTPEQRGRYARGLYGHANLYGVFTDIALRWTRPGGVIAYLTPTSVLGGQYFAALRALLAEEAPPIAIDFVQSRRGVFEDVLQETMLAVFQRSAKPSPAQVHYLKIVDERAATVVRNGTISLPQDRQAPWLAPRAPEQSRLASVASRMPTRLKDWGYRVSTGPLVWNRFKDQLHERDGRNRHPLIWAEAVGADGQFAFRAEKRNHAPYFEERSGDAWLITREPCVLLQRTTAKEQSRRLIAAELPADFLRKHKAVVVENHLNMVRPQGKPLVSATTLAAVLNSTVVDQVFRCISGSVAVSAFELEALPLPPVAAMAEIERLVKAGSSMPVIEAAVAALYKDADPC